VRKSIAPAPNYDGSCFYEIAQLDSATPFSIQVVQRKAVFKVQSSRPEQILTFNANSMKPAAGKSRDEKILQ
jgi:hypothetical protein